MTAVTQQQGHAARDTALEDDTRAVVEALVPVRQEIEAAFLSIGERLRDCATRLGTVTRTFKALSEALDGQEVGDATARLTAVGERAREIEDAFAREQHDVERMAVAVSRAAHPIADLRRAAKTMSIVAINARVVAAGIGGGEGDFDVFTKDIARLSDSATATVSSFFKTYERLAKVIDDASTARQHFTLAYGNALGDLAQRLDARLGAVTEHRQRAAGAAAGTEQVTARIGQSISATVMALQVGDATRQRVEHIGQGLEHAAVLRGGGKVEAVEVGEAGREALANIVVALEESQLSATIKSFDREVAEGERAIQDLACDADDAINQTIAVYDRSGEGGSALAALGEELRRATKVLRLCEAERTKLDRIAQAVSETVESLLEAAGQVQEIEAAMRLVSLNAAVRCAQLGTKARGLNTIAQQLRALTGETSASADKAINQLTEARSIARPFTEAAEAASARRVSGLEDEANKALRLFDSVEDRLQSALSVLTGEGPLVISGLRGALEEIAGHAVLSEGLADIHVRLAALLPDDDMESLLEATPAEAAGQILAVTRRAYTMEEERRIHDALVGSEIGPTSETSEPEEGTSEDDLDALFL